MIHAILGFVSIFPISFLVYVYSERQTATHEARVGKGISTFQFFLQSWVDLLSDLKQKGNKGFALPVLLQLAIVFFLDLNLEFVFLIYLALNLFVLAVSSPCGEEVEQRVAMDRQYMRFLIGAVLAFLSAFGAFASSGSMSLSLVAWAPAFLIYIPIFQVAGMILFAEYPFDGLNRNRHWILSARFYCWCLLSAKLFLGGGLVFFDVHLKAIVLFLFCRGVGQYFPRYMQKDLFRISMLYLIPLAGVFWLLTLLILGVVRSGGFSV